MLAPPYAAEAAMYSPEEPSFSACLDRATLRLQRIRQLNLSTEAAIEQALNESQQVLGALALYRSRLKQRATTLGQQ